MTSQPSRAGRHTPEDQSVPVHRFQYKSEGRTRTGLYCQFRDGTALRVGTILKPVMSHDAMCRALNTHASLLAACEAALAHIEAESENRYGSDEDYRIGASEAFEQLRAAILRAKGGDRA